MAANLDEILSNRFSVSTVENTETIKSTEIQNLEINSDIVIESNITELKQGSTEEDSSSTKEYSSTRNSKISENENDLLFRRIKESLTAELKSRQTAKN